MTRPIPTSYYYSGQGRLLIGERSATGQGLNFFAVGNVTSLTIDLSVTKFEHKESMSGVRSIDATIITEQKATLKFSTESLSLDNLALGMFGTKATTSSTTITDEAHLWSTGGIIALKYPAVSAVTVTVGATDIVASVAVGTPGSSYETAPTVSFTGGGGSGATGTAVLTADAVTSVTITNGGSGYTSAPTVVFSGGGGSGAAGTASLGSSASTTLGTDYTIDADFGTIYPISTSVVFADGATVLVDYTTGIHDKVDALTSGVAPERYMRFEGLNTYDGSLVLLNCPRVALDPITGLEFINENFGKADFTGNILLDSTITSGSQFFTQRNITPA